MAITLDTATDLTVNGIVHDFDKSVDVEVKEIKTPDSANGTVDTTNGHSLVALDASLTTITRTVSPRSLPSLDDPVLKEQRTFTDHMLTCQWTSSEGWQAPTVIPYGPLSIMPSASVLHYATECFEGLKLYRGYDGKKLHTLP
jgi:branched-chain amino acid aminotransferase